MMDGSSSWIFHFVIWFRNISMCKHIQHTCNINRVQKEVTNYSLFNFQWWWRVFGCFKSEPIQKFLHNITLAPFMQPVSSASVVTYVVLRYAVWIVHDVEKRNISFCSCTALEGSEGRDVMGAKWPLCELTNAEVLNGAKRWLQTPREAEISPSTGMVRRGLMAGHLTVVLRWKNTIKKIASLGDQRKWKQWILSFVLQCNHELILWRYFLPTALTIYVDLLKRLQ